MNATAIRNSWAVNVGALILVIVVTLAAYYIATTPPPGPERPFVVVDGGKALPGRGAAGE